MNASSASQANAAKAVCDGRIDLSGLRASLARVALILLTALVMILASRRFGGALRYPLPGVVLVGCGIFAALLATAARRALPRAVRWQLLPTVLMAVFVGCLSLRGTHPAALTALWGSLFIEVAWYWLHRRSSVEPLIPPATSVARLGQPVQVENEGEQEHLDVRQSLVRGTTSAGGDVLNGEVQAVFAAGQRIEHVHLSFCPPFERTPEFDFEQVDGPDARIELGQLLPYGARLELKLSQPGPARVKIAVSARLMPESASSVTDT